MMYPLTSFRVKVVKQISTAISSLYGITCDVVLEKPKDIADAAFPCFQLAKTLKRKPNDIAIEIAREIDEEWVAKTEAISGYVNVYVNTKKLSKEIISGIYTLGNNFGKGADKHKTIIVEHTSANPNGPLHVGRARNPIIGDTLSRLLRFSGYEVKTQYYVDDMGKQVAMLYWGVKNLLSEESQQDKQTDKADHHYVRYYQETVQLMEKDDAVKDEIGDIVKHAELGDSTLLNDIKSAYSKVLDGMIESLRMLNITIDEFIEESRFVLDDSTDMVIKTLETLQYTDRENNALYLDLEPFGIHGRNTRFFITRNDNTSLYATRDIAYHIWKGGQADILINILGEDHKLEAKFVEIALGLLKKKIPESIFYSFVSLPDGKMSTRKGRVVSLDDLLEEAIERAKTQVKKRRETDEDIEYIAQHVASGAIRYNIIKVKSEKPITFKWEEALNFEGQSAPFIQYSYARCCSILRRKKAIISPDDMMLFDHKSEIELIKTLASFPDIISEGMKNRNPSIVADYAYMLASMFNQFYRDCRVIESKNEYSRLILVEATKQVLKNSLGILGIMPLEKM